MKKAICWCKSIDFMMGEGMARQWKKQFIGVKVMISHGAEACLHGAKFIHSCSGQRKGILV